MYWVVRRERIIKIKLIGTKFLAKDSCKLSVSYYKVTIIERFINRLLFLLYNSKWWFDV